MFARARVTDIGGTAGGMEWLLDIALIVLLGATLFHALRLERALGVLRRDRSALEELVTNFNASTRQAELGIERLRGAADGAGKQLARQIDAAEGLKDDLVFLSERGDRLADKLDKLVRAARQIAPDGARAALPEPARGDIGVDTGLVVRPADRARGTPRPPEGARGQEPPGEEPREEARAGEARPRSQAELDLLRALRLTR